MARTCPEQRTLSSAVLTCAMALVGCSRSGELVVGIITDLAASDGVDRVGIQVWTADAVNTSPVPLSQDSVPLTETTPLPGTYTVTGERDAWVRIEVTALAGETRIVERDAVAHLAPSVGPRFFRVALARACISHDSTCPEDQTCIDGACASPKVNDDVLVPYRSELASQLDCLPAGPSRFINTFTGYPLPARGTCADGEVCQEGSCRRP